MGSRFCNSIVYCDRRLSYIGQDAHHIPSVLSKLYGNSADSLDLSYNCLTSLEELRNFPYLSELILDNNQLGDNLEFPFIPSVHTLSLNKNHITNLESFLTKVLRGFPSLRFLSLLGNIACPNQLSDSEKDEEDYQRYRYYVLYRLPGLKFLDSRPVVDDERSVAITRGKYMKIVRPMPNYTVKEEGSTVNLFQYTPLPKLSREANDHQGIYGKCRYRYSGKHSEGNRFIRNHDL